MQVSTTVNKFGICILGHSLREFHDNGQQMLSICVGIVQNIPSGLLSICNQTWYGTLVACHHEQECHVKTFATIKVKATGLYDQNMVKN